VRRAALLAVLVLAVLAAPALGAQRGPSCDCDGRRVLKLERPLMRGPDVLDAQLLLRYLGILRRDERGRYGKRTVVAVRRFQRLHKLRPDGILGGRTWPRLRRSALLKSKLVPARTRTPVLTEAAPTLRLSDPPRKGTAVIDLQGRLRHAGVLTVAPTGLFGPITDRAVRLFQARKGLKVDGIVGPGTWAALGREASRTPPARSVAPQVAPVTSPAPGTQAAGTAAERRALVAKLMAPPYNGRVTFVNCAAADMAREAAGLGTVPSSPSDPPPAADAFPRHVSTTAMQQWIALADAGFTIQIGTLISCHTWHAFEGDGALSGRVSKHPMGLAYDVTAINGVPVTPNLQSTPRFRAFLGVFAKLPAAELPTHVISLIDLDGFEGSVFLAQRTHSDHVHVEEPTPAS
jgi:peptidoglycan hydrolase-like protein with peptidoglycan-binding domain